MNKKLKSDEQGDSTHGYSYFENLPDELVIFIFEKLSSTDDKLSFLKDLKSLGQCSVVSKRFNALTFLVHTLTIQHVDIKTLYRYCPEILKKFKHIRSLQVTHWSCIENEIMRQSKSSIHPIVYWEAAYRPHSYCLAVASYKQISPYSNDSEKQQSLVPVDKDFYKLNRVHTLEMIYLHHMLVSSIKDHEHLQSVVITDFFGRGSLTLEKEVLVELRNCTSTNLENVLERDRYGLVENFDFPFVKRPHVMLNNVFWNIIEWWEKDTNDHVHKDFDGDGVIPFPSVLPFKCSGKEKLGKVLKSLMINPDIVKANKQKVIVEVLSDIKLNGHLI